MPCAACRARAACAVPGQLGRPGSCSCPTGHCATPGAPHTRPGALCSLIPLSLPPGRSPESSTVLLCAGRNGWGWAVNRR